MRIVRTIMSLAVGLCIAATLLVATPAHAGPATGHVDVGTEYGNTLRARFWQNVDKSGYTWETYGSTNCSSTTGDADFSWSDMDSNKNWDNVASYIQDYASCDVKIYRYKNFSEAMTGYVHYGSTGQSFSGSWLNNKTSSYRLS